jgi:hypothetical protein
MLYQAVEHKWNLCLIKYYAREAVEGGNIVLFNAQDLEIELCGPP